MKSAVITRTWFPEVFVPDPDIAELVLRPTGPRQRKNCCMEIRWKHDDGTQSIRKIYTYRKQPN